MARICGQRLVSRDNAPYLQVGPVSRDNDLYLGTTARIRRRRAGIYRYASYPETMRRRSGSGTKKEGDVRSTSPNVTNPSNYLVAVPAGTGGGGLVDGCGVPGVFALRVRPRNGCTPNSATFSARMP